MEGRCRSLGVRLLSRQACLFVAFYQRNLADFFAVANPPSGDQPLNPQDGAGAGNPEGDRYVISIKQVAKFVVGLGDEVSPTDVEEGMRVGYVLG